MIQSADFWSQLGICLQQMQSQGEIKPAVKAPMSKQQMEKLREASKAERKKLRNSSENLFLILSILVIVGVVTCIPDFNNFRTYAAAKGIYVIPFESLIWVLFGFLFQLIGRYSWQFLAMNRFRPHMHPRNKYFTEEDQKDKLETITKQSFDLFYHTVTAIFIFVFFRNEQWFPLCSGGSGSCESVFTSYPHWPEHLNPVVTQFYLFQLGANIYLLLELFVFKRYRYVNKNFNELMFHHFISTILILFSTCYNFVPIGTMVMFVHDSSDAFRALARVVSESRWAIERIPLGRAIDMLYLVIWSYMRIVVFPFCLIVSMYYSLPAPAQDFYFLWEEHLYLMVLSCGIYFLHSYWVFFLAKGNFEQWENNKKIKVWLEQRAVLEREGGGEGKGDPAGEGGAAEGEAEKKRQ